MRSADGEQIDALVNALRAKGYEVVQAEVS
jgi:threonine dehydratase